MLDARVPLHATVENKETEKSLLMTKHPSQSQGFLGLALRLISVWLAAFACIAQQARV